MQTDYKPEYHLAGTIAENFKPSFPTISLQVNGVTIDGEIIDFSKDLTLSKIHKAVLCLNANGYDYFAPTIITTTEKQYEKNLKLFASAMQEAWGKCLLGVHLEGPMINKNVKCAHNPKLMEHDSRKALELFKKILKWSRIPGRTGKDQHAVSLVTIDPSLDPDQNVTRFLSDNGIVVSMGHHMASGQDFRAMVEQATSGATVTHLPNAFGGDNRYAIYALAAAIYGATDVPVQFICDGRHFSFENAKEYLLGLGPERAIITGDESPALFAKPGQYEMFNGLEVNIYAPDVDMPDSVRGKDIQDGFPQGDPLSGSTVPILGQLAHLAQIMNCGAEDPLIKRVGSDNARKLISVPTDRLGIKI